MFIADTHIHFYPGYDLKLAFQSFMSSLNSLNPKAVKGMFLTERSDCCFFSDLKTGRISMPDGFTLQETAEPEALLIKSGNGDSFFIFAGRQISTSERMEVLSLTGDEQLEDGLPAAELISRINSSGTLPVLPWALGKWMFHRKKVVTALLKKFGPDQLILSDSFMRPQLWPEPPAMKYASEKGFTILAGSDPLPFTREEQYMGRYVSLIDGDLDPARPVTSARRLLRSRRHSTRVGTRCNPVILLMRQIKL